MLWGSVLVIIMASINEQSTIPVSTTGNVFFSSNYLLDETAVRTSHDIEALMTRMLTTYANAGFPFCRIYPDIIRADTGDTIILVIDEGERVMISDYLFDVTGNAEVGAIRRLVDLKKNTYFSLRDVTRAKQHLLSTDIFETITDNIIRRDSRYYVLFNLLEKNNDYIAVLGSFAQENFVFSVAVSSRNLLGTLRQLQFRYEYQKLFSLEATDPVLLAPRSLNGYFALWTYDSVRLMQLKGKITAPLGTHFELSLLSGIETFSSATDSGTNYSDNVLGIGLAMNYGASIYRLHHAVNFEYLFRADDRWNLLYDGESEYMGWHLGTHYYRVHTDSLAYFDFFRIGGAKSLRGYLEEEFITSRAWWINTEYRRYVVFPLVDVGIIGDALKLSYGFGIDVPSTIARTTLVFAWPRRGTWRDGKIHLMVQRAL